MSIPQQFNGAHSDDRIKLLAQGNTWCQGGQNFIREGKITHQVGFHQVCYRGVPTRNKTKQKHYQNTTTEKLHLCTHYYSDVGIKCQT